MRNHQFDQAAAEGTLSDAIIFESREPYHAQRIGAAAIYCSDGRFGGHCDDFLHNCLGLPRYDRLVVPGGPASLAGHFITYRESDALTQQLAFLIEAHGLERIVLIGHEGCAFYTDRLHVAPADVAERQHEDLRKAAERVKAMSGRLTIDGYMAGHRDDRVVFESIALDAPRPRGLRTAWV